MKLTELQVVCDAAWQTAQFNRTSWRNLRPFNRGLAENHLRSALEIERGLEKLGYIPREERIATGDRDVPPVAFTKAAERFTKRNQQ
jgi:hypothetical protein